MNVRNYTTSDFVQNHGLFRCRLFGGQNKCINMSA